MQEHIETSSSPKASLPPKGNWLKVTVNILAVLIVLLLIPLYLAITQGPPGRDLLAIGLVSALTILFLVFAIFANQGEKRWQQYWLEVRQSNEDKLFQEMNIIMVEFSNLKYDRGSLNKEQLQKRIAKLEEKIESNQFTILEDKLLRMKLDFSELREKIFEERKMLLALKEQVNTLVSSSFQPTILDESVNSLDFRTWQVDKQFADKSRELDKKLDNFLGQILHRVDELESMSAVSQVLPYKEAFVPYDDQGKIDDLRFEVDIQQDKLASLQNKVIDIENLLKNLASMRIESSSSDVPCVENSIELALCTSVAEMVPPIYTTDRPTNPTPFGIVCEAARSLIKEFDEGVVVSALEELIMLSQEYLQTGDNTEPVRLENFQRQLAEAHLPKLERLLRQRTGQVEAQNRTRELAKAAGLFEVPVSVGKESFDPDRHSLVAGSIAQRGYDIVRRVTEIGWQTIDGKVLRKPHVDTTIN